MKNSKVSLMHMSMENYHDRSKKDHHVPMENSNRHMCKLEFIMPEGHHLSSQGWGNKSNKRFLFQRTCASSSSRLKKRNMHLIKFKIGKKKMTETGLWWSWHLAEEDTDFLEAMHGWRNLVFNLATSLMTKKMMEIRILIWCKL